MIMMKNNVKIKFDLDDDLPLSKTVKIHNVPIFVRAVFHEITNIIRTFS